MDQAKSFPDEFVDKVVLHIKANCEHVWKMLRASTKVAELNGFDATQPHAPADIITAFYVGNSADLFEAVRDFARSHTPSGAELVTLAAQVCLAVPRHMENYDTFTAEEKAVAIRAVQEKLPEAWARMVRRMGDRLLPEDEEKLGQTRVQISDLLETLPVNWLKEPQPRLLQSGILYRHVMDAARRAANN